MSGEAAAREFMEALVRALTAAGVLPPWAMVLLLLIVIPLLFLWYHWTLSWPPGWDLPNVSPPMPVQSDGTVHLNQKPPENYL